MAIKVTENAAKQIQRRLAKQGIGIALRIGVKKVGCTALVNAARCVHSGRQCRRDARTDRQRVMLPVPQSNP